MTFNEYKIVVKAGSKIELYTWSGSFKPNVLEQDIILTIKSIVGDLDTFLSRLIGENILNDVTFGLLRGETDAGKVLGSMYHSVKIKCKDILLYDDPYIREKNMKLILDKPVSSDIIEYLDI